MKGDKATCPVCGTEFTKATHHQKYDSRRCCWTAYILAHPAKAQESRLKANRKQYALDPAKCRAASRRYRAANIEAAREREREQYWRIPCRREKSLKNGRLWRGRRYTLRMLAGLAALENTMNAQMELSAEKADVKTWTTERLKEEFAAGLKITRDHLLRLACILAELEARGEQVDGDKHLLNLLRRVGDGSLLVDAVVRFAGRPQTLSTVGKMTPEKQAEILGYGDEEAEEVVKKHRHPASRRHAGDAKGMPPTFFGAAAKGTPKDVAAMCLKLIRESSDPDAVAEAMLPELQRMKNAPKPKPARVGYGED